MVTFNDLSGKANIVFWVWINQRLWDRFEILAINSTCWHYSWKSVQIKTRIYGSYQGLLENCSNCCLNVTGQNPAAESFTQGLGKHHKGYTCQLCLIKFGMEEFCYLCTFSSSIDTYAGEKLDWPNIKSHYSSTLKLG